jgi:hypothetical protein
MGVIAVRAATGEVTKPILQLTIQVQTPDGKPVGNEPVVCIDMGTNAVLKGRTIVGGGARLRTDVQGRFSLTTSTNENIALMISGDAGSVWRKAVMEAAGSCGATLGAD